MSSCYWFFVSALVFPAIGAKPAVKYYASKYEHVSVEDILNNRRMVNYYAACLLAKGPCPPEGVDLKRILPEALQTTCARCTEKQAAGALRVIKRLRKEYPKIWTELTAKWDPDEAYVKRFEESLAGKGSLQQQAKPAPSINTRFGFEDDGSSENNIDSHFSPTTSATVNDLIQQTTAAFTTKSHSSLSTQSTSLVKHTISSSTPSSSSSSASTSRSTTTSTKPTIATKTPARASSTKKPSSAPPPRPQPIPGLVPVNTFYPNPPIPIVNLNLGGNIGATVSGLVRGLGAIGTRVVETGAEIAQVVIKNLARPLPL